MKDYYYILGLIDSATPDEIKEAYKKLSKKFHPDMNDGDKFFEERFKEIQEAYEVLSDSIKRNNYDLKRKRVNPTEDNPKAPATENNTTHPSTTNTTNPIKEESSNTWKGLLFLIGIALFILFIFYLTHQKGYVKNMIEESKPKEICDCKINLTDDNIELKKYSFESDVSVYVHRDFDSLYGNVDSIIEKEFEKNKRFDNDVEDLKGIVVYHYKYNKLVNPNHSSDETIPIYDGQHKLIKKILKDGKNDSTTLKYEYQECNNHNLSSIKVYDNAGNKIANCTVSYNNNYGSISIVTLVRDWRPSSYPDNVTKDISNYNIKVDRYCKVQSIKLLWSDGINQREDNEIYNDKGLVVESESFIIKKTKNILGSTHNEYQYDNTGNWITKTTNNAKITRRKIFYHSDH